MKLTSAVPGQTARRCGDILDEVERAVVGHRRGLELVLIAILAGGHVLLEDLPGLGKTLTARSFAQVLGLSFARIQFTPDLLPSDVVGAPLYDQRTGEMVFRPGPVFTQLLLADEINRTPPKTQAALLEAMGEGQVSMDGVTRMLPQPFVVLATDNPIEYEGTYELPEAQLDRFLIRLRLGYLQKADEIAMLARRLDRKTERAELRQVVDAAELLAMRESLEQVEVSPDLLDYVVSIVGATREHPQIQVGASPRGGLALVQLARGQALLRQRDYVIPDDVKSVAVPALAHRITLRPELWVRQVWADDVVARLLATVPVPRTDPTRPPAARRRAPAEVPGGAAAAVLPAGSDDAREYRVSWSLSGHARRLLTLALAGLVIAVLTGRPEFAGVAAPAVLLLATWRPGRPASVLVRVGVTARQLVEGEQATVVVTVRGQRGYTVQAEIKAAEAFMARPAARAGAGQGVLRVPFQAGQWGIRRIGRVEIVLRDRFWLSEGLLSLELPRVDCHPRPPSCAARSCSAGCRRLGEHPSRAAGEGIEFAGVREFVPGDRQRRINWAATTRTGTIQLNTFTAERTQNVVVLADATTNVGEAGSTSLDLAFRAAAGTINCYLAAGDRVGLIVYADRLSWLGPGLGRRHFHRLMDLLLASHRGWERADGLTRLPKAALPPGALILVFSPLLHPRLVEALRDLRERGFSRAGGGRADRRAVAVAEPDRRADPADLAAGAAGDQVLADRAGHPRGALGRPPEPGRAAGPLHPARDAGGPEMTDATRGGPGGASGPEAPGGADAVGAPGRLAGTGWRVQGRRVAAAALLAAAVIAWAAAPVSAARPGPGWRSSWPWSARWRAPAGWPSARTRSRAAPSTRSTCGPGPRWPTCCAGCPGPRA